MKKIGNRTILLENNTGIISHAGVAGPKESEGPLGKYFDKCFSDSLMGEDSWEKAESFLQKTAVKLAVAKLPADKRSPEAVFAGDLLNQCIASSFGLMEFGLPFVGLYGACSTMALSLINASVYVDSFCFDQAVAVTSSHFCSAERQYRYPLEYGCFRPPTAQWTVTGSGAAILSRDANIMIKSFTLGKITELGITDANNMGAAMAPAAADTIVAYLNDTDTIPDDYDVIFTGDLGSVGTELLYKLADERGTKLRGRHKDCGNMIFDPNTQDVHAGGSGCGCSASVLCSYILSEMDKGNLSNILFCATGALLSTTSSQQGEVIPCIAHLINICRG